MSRSPKPISALVEAHNAKAAFQVRYFGLEAREQLLAHLIAAEPRHEDSVRFLLDRQHWGDLPTYGLSRSLALLLGVGSRVMIFDDDVLCEAVRSPLPEEPLHFGGITSRKAVFWSGNEEQEAAKKGLKDSPIALMARQLGSTLSAGIGTLSHGELPDGRLGRRERRLRKIFDARVAHTANPVQHLG